MTSYPILNALYYPVRLINFVMNPLGDPAVQKVTQAAVDEVSSFVSDFAIGFVSGLHATSQKTTSSQQGPDLMALCERAALHADPDPLAPNYLRFLYRESHPEEEQIGLVRSFKIHAHEGDCDAQFYLASCYYLGGILPQKPAKAVKWYNKSASQYHSGALFLLGVCYQYGHGVSPSKSMAYDFYTKAANYGNLDALKAREAVDSRFHKTLFMVMDVAQLSFSLAEQLPSFLSFLTRNLRIESIISIRNHYLLQCNGHQEAAVEAMLKDYQPPFSVRKFYEEVISGAITNIIISIADRIFPCGGLLIESAREARILWKEVRVVYIMAAIYGHNIQDRAVKIRILNACVAPIAIRIVFRAAMRHYEANKKLIEVIASVFTERFYLKWVIKEYVLPTVIPALDPIGLMFEGALRFLPKPTSMDVTTHAHAEFGTSPLFIPEEEYASSQQRPALLPSCSSS